MGIVNLSGSGCIAPKTVSNEASSFRVAQYPDGSKRVQGAYQWSKGHLWGHEWKDLPLVYVNNKGEELEYASEMVK